MEEVTLVKDFAIIMVVAGVMTLLFRRLRQPAVLGYLIAGLLIGPYTLPTPPVTDLHTISLLADLGLILLLFGLGLEFSWSKIRQVGLAVLIIGVSEILVMISLGYVIGQLLGWSKMDSIFLGAALHISSSAIIVKILRDSGRLSLQSSRIIVGILVVEDFAAVVILTLLSGMAATGTASLGDIGSLVFRLVAFVVASLTLGAFIVPRVVRFTSRVRSSEALLITTLGLCFTMALLGRYLGLSVAAGAFLMGSLIGDTQEAEEVTKLVTPIRDMFAAIFFVAIGMLINVSEFAAFAVPAVIVSAVFMVGKMVMNASATFMCGYDGRTAVQVGMGQPVMGEFSLAIAKLGVDRGVVLAPLYPVIALVTAVTALAGPFISRSADAASDQLQQRSPAIVRQYGSRLADWLQAIRAVFSSSSPVAQEVKHSVRMMLINLLIVIVIVGVGTFTLDLVRNLPLVSNMRDDVLGLIVGLALVVLCVAPFISIWRNLESLADEAATYVLRRRQSAKWFSREALRIILRDSILVVVAVFLALWLIPFMATLLSIGSFAIAVPVLLLAVILFLSAASARQIHREVERAFARTLLGEGHTSDVEGIQAFDHRRRRMLVRLLKLPWDTIRRLWHRGGHGKTEG